MTEEAWTKNYADRIAEGAAKDGMPWTLSRAEAVWLASRYGVEIDGAGKLREVAFEIASKILSRNA